MMQQSVRQNHRPSGLITTMINLIEIIQLKSFANAIKALSVELLFQFFQYTAGGRLGHYQSYGGAAEVLLAGNLQKKLQLLESQFHELIE